MADPPAEKESITISMVVEGSYWKLSDRNRPDQVSGVHPLNGFLWSIRIKRVPRPPKYADVPPRREAFLVCDKAKEAELWKCTAVVRWTPDIGNGDPDIENGTKTHVFASWLEQNSFCFPTSVREGNRIVVEITTADHENMWISSPILNPQVAPNDCILTIGEENEKIEVNKEFLAAHCSFFKNQFEGDWKDKDEIHIGEVEYEEFANMLKMLSRSKEVSLTDQNAARTLALAEKFDFKIIADRVLNFILSSASSLPVPQKLRLTERHNNPIVESWIASQSFATLKVKEIRASPELMELSIETVRELFKKKEPFIRIGDDESSDDEDSPPVKKSKDDETVSPDAECNQNDGILVFGDEKIHVNKQLLISYSRYFGELFKGNWKEKNMSEITIKDVTSEEFSDFIRIAYGMEDISLTETNLERMLQLADRFMCKIVVERFASASIGTLSIHEKLVMSEPLHYVKEILLAMYKKNQHWMHELSQMSELEELSIETVRSLFEMKADLWFDD